MIPTKLHSADFREEAKFRLHNGQSFVTVVLHSNGEEAKLRGVAH